jgi:cytochrome c-type biogenesis protein CcmE
MRAKRRQRLAFAGLVLAGGSIATVLVIMALGQNMNLFYSPAEVAAGEAPPGHRIRVGGLVADGSVDRDPDSLNVQFDLTDNVETVQVSYEGILPDLFREGQGIIALGRLTGDRVFQAEEVLAKHDENYMPPEVADALAEVEGMHNK